MSGIHVQSDPESVEVDLGTPLVEYANRLLLSTGLAAQDALFIASGRHEAPPELATVTRALRAGWNLAPPDPEKLA